MIADWKSKYKQYSIKGRKYWYKTDDGGQSWRKVSSREVLNFIESQGGIIIY